MRGKLRDKRTDPKRGYFKRELLERRRTAKRANRMMARLKQQMEEENYLLDNEEEAKVSK